MKQLIGLAISIICVGCFSKDKNTENEKEVLDTITSKTTKTESVINNAANGDGILWGFSNEAGKEILNINNDTIITASDYTHTISKEGKLIPIHFIKQKKATSEDNNRQNYYNFGASGGYLFAIENGNVNSDQTTILLSKDFVASHTVLPFHSMKKNELLPQEMASKISASKERKIKKQRALIDIDQVGKIYLVEFEIKKDSALVSLVLVTPTTIVYKDFPAQYDEMSTWGVDDGGEFGLEYYTVIAVFKNKGNLEIITDWSGVEGNSTEYLKQEGNTFKRIKTGYRYTSPL
ncbi:hypothetical protein [Flavobacterium sp. '19STA2R22 D10 B1']|uniref:hypothetical protein n=1 Tax=Flavobacterium aerium TaxID=3037261 RepID=UPI00278C1561|nr:hypothetical protein [Flavobacterium sp. '19STA2R22 D10 B1']